MNTIQLLRKDQSKYFFVGLYIILKKKQKKSDSKMFFFFILTFNFVCNDTTIQDRVSLVFIIQMKCVFPNFFGGIGEIVPNRTIKICRRVFFLVCVNKICGIFTKEKNINKKKLQIKKKVRIFIIQIDHKKINHEFFGRT